MIVSDARIVANRSNSALSTGPRTPEGKERSRRNAVKHGLTGEGVASPVEDLAEVESRFQDLVVEMRPSGTSSRLLLRRYASMSVRLEKCERLDAAVYSKRVRHADEDFLDHRLTNVEALASRLNFDPMTVARRLQNTPEGIDWLIKHWGELRVELMNRERKVWTMNHASRMERLMGRLEAGVSQPRSHALTEGLGGFFANINPSEIEGLNEQEQVEWARVELSRMIDDEIVRLEQVKSALDPWKIEQDRLEAVDRCLFDLQPAMNQVRKYEAATERSMYKALKEFHALEAILKANREAIEKDSPKPEVGSFESEVDPNKDTPEPIDRAIPRTPLPLPQIPETIQFPSKRSLDAAPNFFGHEPDGIG